MTLAADDADTFYATWLDDRSGRKHIYFAQSRPGAEVSWNPNVKVYGVPGAAVCECCRPSVAVSGRNIAIMFRNSLQGFRDLYLATSVDQGKSFSQARKLGNGSWKLDGCPMDGGALTIGAVGQVTTVWRRENTIYSAKPGEPEVTIANGRSPMMGGTADAPFLIWQDGDHVRLRAPHRTGDVVVGDGRLPQVIALPNGMALAAWERDGKVYFTRV